MGEFWNSTPAEIYASIEAYTWGLEQQQQQLAWGVWHIAALTRAKKLPPLSALMKPKDAQPLTDDEKAVREQEFREMVEKYGNTR